MVDHVGQHASNVLIGDQVKDAVAPTLRLDQPAGPQQAQMVADQGRRQTQAFRHVADRSRRVQARNDDPQAAAIGHQPEHVGQFDRLVFADAFVNRDGGGPLACHGVSPSVPQTSF